MSPAEQTGAVSSISRYVFQFFSPRLSNLARRCLAPISSYFSLSHSIVCSRLGITNTLDGTAHTCKRLPDCILNYSLFAEKNDRVLMEGLLTSNAGRCIISIFRKKKVEDLLLRPRGRLNFSAHLVLGVSKPAGSNPFCHPGRMKSQLRGTKPPASPCLQPYRAEKGIEPLRAHFLFSWAR